jgi:TolB-like protein/class 3 adenylate cyclase/Flp pilus assembly protein TadD
VHPQSDLSLEIAHLLLIDVVGYSKLLVNEQIELVQQLNRIVRETECFRAAESDRQLIRVPTGDGMALLFFRSPEEPVRCALEIAEALKAWPQIQVRMGIHSGPVNQVRDVNDQVNVAGAGINVAQRVMDCADAGHILLSDHVANDLAQYGTWRPHLQSLGECEVKHGLRLNLFNLCKNGLGNPVVPEKLRRRNVWKRESRSSVRPVSPPRWPISLLVAVLLLTLSTLGITLWMFLGRGFKSLGALEPGAVASISDKSIAVLPFENLSDEQQNGYFADGVQDEILTDLAKVADLKVISRTSVMQYKSDIRRNLREIAKELGVAHVLEGSVQRAAGRVRISAQLVDARTDTHVWAEHYERDLSDVFAVESEVSEKIVSQLKSKLSAEEKTAIEKPVTSDLVAFDEYVRAGDLVNKVIFNSRAKEKLNEASQLLERAVNRDPDFFLAYCRLVRTHDLLYFLGLDRTPNRRALAEAALKTAGLLRPDAAEYHLESAAHLYFVYRNYDQARAEIQKAKRALPNEPFIFELSGYIDRRQGRWLESVSDFQRALELDPHNASTLKQLAASYLSMRQFHEAAVALDRGLRIVPNDQSARIGRALVDLYASADPQPLREVISSILSHAPEAAPDLADHWLFLALCQRDLTEADKALQVLTEQGCAVEAIPFPKSVCEGVVAVARGDSRVAQERFLEARAQLAQVVDQQPRSGEALCALAMVDAHLGRKKEAIEEGRRAVDLVPLNKDSINGPLTIKYLGLVYAWSGEKQLAFEQLRSLTTIPAHISYGELRLYPEWDPLRGDPEFDKIVASFASK